MTQTKTQYRKGKRTLALFLCFVFALVMLPMSAFAAGGALTHDRNGTRYTYTIGYMYSGNQGGINRRQIMSEPNNYTTITCPVCGDGGYGTVLAENLYMPCYAYDVPSTGGDLWIRYAQVRHRHNNGQLADFNVYVPINVAQYSGCYYGYDIENPSRPAIAAPSGWQKSSARVTFSGGTDSGTSLPDWTATPGNYGSGIHHYEYSLDGGAWTGCPTNDASVTITKGGETTVTARAVDGAGNASIDTVSAKVYVDNVAPNRPTVSPSFSGWTNQNVSVTLKDNGDTYSGVNRTEVSSDGGAYSRYANAVTLSAHGIHTVAGRVVDNVGHVSAVEQQKVYIDKVAPTISAVNQTPSANLTMTLNVTATDADSGLKGYAVTSANSAPAASAFSTTMPTVSKNGTYYVWAIDNAGNISSGKEVKVTALDSVPPVVTKVETQRTWDAAQNWAKITATDDNRGVVKIGWAASENGKVNWQNAESTYTFEFAENAIYYAFAQDAAGNVSAPVAFVIDRIDKVNPIVDATNFDAAWTQEKTIDVTGVDKESGVGQYALTTTNAQPTVWQDGSTFGGITENGTYYAWVKDNVQRVSVPLAVKIDTIDRTKPQMDSIVHSSTDNAPEGKFAYPLFNVVDRPTLTARDEAGVKEIQYQFVADAAEIVPDKWAVYSEAEKPAMTAEFLGTVVGKAVDYAGNESDLIDAKFLFEETNPIASHILSDDGWTNDDVTITVTADDNFSGVRDITLPDGAVVEGDTATYTVSVCDVYDFAIRDNCGNTLNYPVTVKNIDLIAPELSHTLKPDTWTNDKVTIQLTAKDAAPEDGYAPSGVDFITLPDDTVVEGDKADFDVTENGWYEFTVTDKAGNSSDYRVEVKNLDHLAPKAEYTITPDSWTNQTVTIKVTATDPAPDDGYEPSGVKSIQMPDETVVDADSSEFVVKINGSYDFLVTDHAGNKTTLIVPVKNIDLVKPTVDFHFAHSEGMSYPDYGAKPEYYNKDITLTAAAEDDASGIDRYEYKVADGDWQTFTLEKPPVFTEEQAATITVRVWDIAGNVSEEKARDFLLDKTPPTATHTLTADKNGKMTINFSADSSIAGTGSIVKPDGAVVYAVSGTAYEVAKNGEYPFVVWDRCGNQTTYTVPVTQIAVPAKPQKPETPQPTPEVKPQPEPEIFVEPVMIPQETVQPGLTVMDLLLTLFTVALAILSVLRLHKKKPKGEEHRCISGYDVLSIVFAALSVLLLFITQPLVWRFRFVDWWTVFFAILAIGNAILLFVSRKNESTERKEKTQPNKHSRQGLQS